MLKKMNVLFLCTGNSARSILGEAILRQHGGDRFNAFSAGSQPLGKVNPMTLELLQNLKYETKDLRSKSWEEFSKEDSPEINFVFTVCGSAAEETCPVWQGTPLSAHWGIDDPAAPSLQVLCLRPWFSVGFLKSLNPLQINRWIVLGQGLFRTCKYESPQ